MSRQATKYDLEHVLSELGISFDGKPSVAELREWMHTEFLKLHDALAMLGHGAPGKGTHANQKRLHSLYAAALAKREELRNAFIREEERR
jgi:hypothetical protein